MFTVGKHPTKRGYTIFAKVAWAPLGRFGWFKRKRDAEAYAAVHRRAA